MHFHAQEFPLVSTVADWTGFVAEPETIVPMGKWLSGKAASQRRSRGHSCRVPCANRACWSSTARSASARSQSLLISTQTLGRQLSSEGSCALKLSLGGALGLLCDYSSSQASEVWVCIAAFWGGQGCSQSLADPTLQCSFLPLRGGQVF